MKHPLRNLFALVTLLFACTTAVGDATPSGQLRDFRQGSFASVVEGRAGGRFLLVLWSVECPPCFREFQVFTDLRAEGRELPLVLVATDPPEQRAEVVAALERFALLDVENWHFAEADANRLRFEVDPAWYGEMPRSYYYAADGSRSAHSGGLKREQVEAWLAEGVAER